ncbi:hypothetical protein CAAN3_07S03312 [[Candida] anglica]
MMHQPQPQTQLEQASQQLQIQQQNPSSLNQKSLVLSNASAVQNSQNFYQQSNFQSIVQPRKFLHLTIGSKTLLQVCDDLIARYAKLYPDDDPLEVEKLQNGDCCDLDPDYIVDQVFQSGDIVQVIVNNDFEEMHSTFLDPPSTSASRIAKPLTTPSASRLMSEQSQSTPIVPPAPVLSSKKRSSNFFDTFDANIPKKTRRSIWSTSTRALPRLTADTSVGSSSLPVLDIKKKRASRQVRSVQSSPNHLDMDESNISLPPPEETSFQNEASHIIPQKKVLPDQANVISQEIQPTQRVTSGMLSVPVHVQLEKEQLMHDLNPQGSTPTVITAHDLSLSDSSDEISEDDAAFMPHIDEDELSTSPAKSSPTKKKSSKVVVSHPAPSAASIVTAAQSSVATSNGDGHAHGDDVDTLTKEEIMGLFKNGMRIPAKMRSRLSKSENVETTSKSANTSRSKSLKNLEITMNDEGTILTTGRTEGEIEAQRKTRAAAQKAATKFSETKSRRRRGDGSGVNTPSQKSRQNSVAGLSQSSQLHSDNTQMAETDHSILPTDTEMQDTSATLPKKRSAKSTPKTTPATARRIRSSTKIPVVPETTKEATSGSELVAKVDTPAMKVSTPIMKTPVISTPSISHDVVMEASPSKSSKKPKSIPAGLGITESQVPPSQEVANNVAEQNVEEDDTNQTVDPSTGSVSAYDSITKKSKLSRIFDKMKSFDSRLNSAAGLIDESNTPSPTQKQSVDSQEKENVVVQAQSNGNGPSNGEQKVLSVLERARQELKNKKQKNGGSPGSLADDMSSTSSGSNSGTSNTSVSSTDKKNNISTSTPLKDNASINKATSVSSTPKQKAEQDRIKKRAEQLRLAKQNLERARRTSAEKISVPAEKQVSDKTPIKDIPVPTASPVVMLAATSAPSSQQSKRKYEDNSSSSSGESSSSESEDDSDDGIIKKKQPRVVAVPSAAPKKSPAPSKLPSRNVSTASKPPVKTPSTTSKPKVPVNDTKVPEKTPTSAKKTAISKTEAKKPAVTKIPTLTSLSDLALRGLPDVKDASPSSSQQQQQTKAIALTSSSEDDSSDSDSDSSSDSGSESDEEKSKFINIKKLDKKKPKKRGGFFDLMKDAKNI